MHVSSLGGYSAPADQLPLEDAAWKISKKDASILCAHGNDDDDDKSFFKNNNTIVDSACWCKEALLFLLDNDVFF